jgi:Tol biopolymer transport system component
MTLSTGTKLSHYEITSQIGKGGMGEVYQAKDQKLGRDVAIKVLPQEFAQDADRVARFQREAKLLASLNHPNIAAIHGLEEADGTHFLVMELVEGQTLAERIKADPIPVEEALKLALQIAEALEAAHEKAVIHRDLKPANIKVTPDGKVKVLDFGLAKAYAGDTENINLSNSPTLSDAATQQGVILGTAAYMSPEQARGKPIDKRADIWAFGCVLYECLTGRQPFRGETVSDVLATILIKEPDCSILPADTPPRVRELLERCLTKELKNRLRDIGDARQNLERVQEPGMSEAKFVDVAGEITRSKKVGIYLRRAIIPALIIALGAAIGIGGWILWHGDIQSSTSRGGEVNRLSVTFPDYLRVASCSLSPDGRTVGILGRPRNPEKPEDDINRLYTRQLDSSDWKLVPRSENGVDAFTFSPDSQWLAMIVPVDPGSNDLQLWKVSLDGKTPPQALAKWADDWNTPFLWLPDDDLIALTINQELVRIPTDSSPPRIPVPIRPDGFTGVVQLTHGYQSILPDGRHVLGQVYNFSEEGFRIDIVVFDAETGDARIVRKNAGQPRCSSTGHLLFSRVDTIYAIRFDPVDLVTVGGPVAITDGLYTSEAWNHGWFDLTQNGDLIHRPGGLVGQSRKLQWMDRDTYTLMKPWSKDLRPFTETSSGGGIQVSRDGSHLVVQIPDSGGIFDCWLSAVEQPGLRRFIHEPGWDCHAHCFTPDSQELIYSLKANPIWRIYKRRVDGSGKPVLLFENRSSPTEFFFPHTLTANGKHLIMTHSRSDGGFDLALLPLEAGPDGSRATKMLMADARLGLISPDDSLLLYQSEASGKWEWYVRTISRDGDLGRELQLTTDGGSAFWRRPVLADGSWELVHIYKGLVYRYKITADSGLRVTKHELIGEWDRDVIDIDQLPDGRILAITRGDDEVEEFTSMTIVLNWVTELSRRLDTSGK